MDDLDAKIISELSKDVQRSFLSIAREIGVSPKTVLARYEKLREKRIILGSSVIVNLGKLGFKGKAYLVITNAAGFDKIETIDALKQIPNIFSISEIIAGDADVHALAAVKDFNNVINLVNEIRKLPSVDRVEVTFTDDTTFPLGENFNALFRIQEKTNV